MTATVLSDDAFRTVQRALDRMADEAIDLGMTVRIETDFEEFAYLRRSVGDGFLYPSFDPAVSRLARDAFWVRADNDDGELLAMVASRVFRCDDFMALVRNERVWFDRGPHGMSRGYSVLPTRLNDPVWGGVVGHGGGFFVHPRARGHGLSVWLPMYQRALMVRMYGVDWHTNFVSEAMAERSKRAYGYPDVELIIDGYFPPMRKDQRVYISRISRAEIVRQLEADEFDRRTTRVDRRVPALDVGAPLLGAGSRPGGSD